MYLPLTGLPLCWIRVSPLSAKLRGVSEILGDEKFLHAIDSPLLVEKCLHVNKKLANYQELLSGGKRIRSCHFYIIGRRS